MRIGELSHLANVPAKTIRYYEEAGLLPAPPRTPSGYRDYDDSAAVRLRFIRSGQSVGLSLGEIREVLAFRDRGEAPCAHVTTLIEEHARDLEERIAALESMRAELTRLASLAKKKPAKDTAYCHILELGRQASMA